MHILSKLFIMYLAIISLLYLAYRAILAIAHSLMFPSSRLPIDRPITTVEVEKGIELEYVKVGEGPNMMLYLHGNAGCLTTMWAKELNRLYQILGPQWTVIGYDYRGYGHSTGSSTYRNLLGDVHKMLSHFGFNNVLAYGRSLGGAPALEISSDPRVKAVFLETPYLGVKTVHTLGKFPLVSSMFPVNSNGCQVPVTAVLATNDTVLDPKIQATLLPPSTKVVEVPTGHNNSYDDDKTQEALKQCAAILSCPPSSLPDQSDIF